MQGSVVLIAEFVTGNKGRAHGNLDESIYHHITCGIENARSGQLIPKIESRTK
jgi:hypothetical protein